MTWSARPASQVSSPWMCDCGCFSTQPWWRPNSVAWKVTTSGQRMRRARRSPARPTSQSWPWTRSKSSRAASSAPAAAMSRFIRRTQRRKASRSRGVAPSGTRWTTTPLRSSSGGSSPSPRVSTWTSTPWATRPSESLRTCRASPPSTMGGYSHERIRTRGGTAAVEATAAGHVPIGRAASSQRRDHLHRPKEAGMKYALLIFNPDNWADGLSEADRASQSEEYFAIREDPRVLDGGQLQGAETATTLRERGDETLTTDGPFADTKEVFAGYYIMEASDLDEALEVAARIPARRTGSVEVRPLVEYPGA